MTKPTKIALGIAVGGLACGVASVATSGVASFLWTWTTIACAIAAAAYVLNRPSWLGKHNGRLSVRALALLPYHVALRIAFVLMRWWRGHDAPSRVAPGLWVGGRVDVDSLPPRVTIVVDLVAEYAAPAEIRRRPGYRSLPVLDGAAPPDRSDFLGLVRELAGVDDDVLVHCDSGRGRAPTMAAALVIARGLAPDVASAVELVRAGRSVAAPTRSDLEFLAGILPALREIGRSRWPLPRASVSAQPPASGASR